VEGVRGGSRPLFYYQLACEMTNIGYLRFAPGQNTTPGKGPREKRLERNRESARKCRRKRKAYVGDLEGKYQDLAEENAMLHLENERLQELVQQLQNGMGNLPQSAHKRVKSEFGVSMANDLSESAVPATQQSQLEISSPLAILTTLLLLAATLVWTTMHLLVPYLVTRSSVSLRPPAHPQVAKPMDLPCDQRASRRRSSIVI
jgi:hypothetical protein